MENRVCNRCVLDTTVSDIWFDDKGECKYCKIHDEMERRHPLNEGEERLKVIIDKIKKAGRENKYDCVCGLSGGRDSSYTLLKAIDYGLRPLVVSVDNGWGTKISGENIENACRILNLDIIKVKFDWEEYKDIQRAFFFASVPDVDSPSDFAIYAQLSKTAKEYNIRYILNGHSFRTEGSSPISWSYFDPVYIKDIQSKFGHIKYSNIKSIATMTPWDLFKRTFVNRIKEIRILEYIDYRKSDVDEILKKRINWQDYGGHHHENKFTHFIQSYYLPQKFNIDKRKTELSAQIRSGHITRERAEQILAAPYGYDQEIVDYVIEQLGFSKQEFEIIMKTPNKSYNDYKTLQPIYRLLSLPINIATRLGFLPRILFLKYCN